MKIISTVVVGFILLIYAKFLGLFNNIPAEWIGLIGVIIGGSITTTKDIWLAKLEKKENASYAAAQLIITLENYRWKCLKVLKEDRDKYEPPYDDNPDQVEGITLDLKFPEDIILKSLERTLSTELLFLQNSIQGTNQYINYVESVADVNNWFDYRKKEYLNFAKKSSSLAKKLHEYYKHPENFIDSENSSHSKFMTLVNEWEKEEKR